MAQWEHYEVWSLAGDKWQLIGSFAEFDVAAAVARTRPARVRLLRVVFEDSKRLREETLVEIGETRKTG